MEAMKSLKDIMARTSFAAQMGLSEPAQATESRTRAHGEWVTLEQARAEGIAHDEPPEPHWEACAFCGKQLWRRGMVLDMMGVYRIARWLGMEICTCEEGKKADRRRLERREQERQQEEERKQREAELRRISRLIGRSGMGRRFRLRTFESFTADDTNRRAFEICKRYADTFGERKQDGAGLYLSGGCGIGKTHLAASIANLLLDKGVPVVLLTMQRILDLIKDTYDEDGELSTAEVLEQFRSCALLIIDDLGKEQPTGWAQSELYRLVNDRYEQMKPVIVTTNYSDEDLGQRLSCGRGCDPVTAESIISRLHEMTYAVPMGGADRRIAIG